MYWIAAVFSGCFLILLCLARKEAAPPDVPALLKPFYKIGLYLYKRMYRFFPRAFSSLQVERDLHQLHPGEAGEYLKTEYYVKKMAVFFLVVYVGTLFGAAARYSAQSSIVLEEDGTIARGDYREGAREVSIVADYDQQQLDFQIQVEPRLLSEEERSALAKEFLDDLPEYILGENEDLGNVTSNLRLEKSYEGFPFQIQWESSRPGIISDAGQIFPVEKPEQATISYRLSYDEYEETGEVDIVLAPPALTEEDRLYAEMEEMLARSQRESLAQGEWKLPLQWRGGGIQWQQAVEDNSLLLWGAAVVTGILVYFFLDRDLHGQIEKRKEVLRREYPEIVHKLVLFVGAGMTVRGAFQKIAGDYETRHKEGGRESPAYEEILYTCRELRSGVSEGQSYEHFGKRTGLQEYVRLSALLSQNLKKGSSTLLERLRKEADKSAEDRLQQSKKLGEEAGTKLLVPMVLMLAIVMAVIMIPAFSNM